MKNFIITKDYNANEVDQIPIIMELYQYQENVRTLNDMTIGSVFNPSGAIGNSSLVYAVDCSWASPDAINLIALQNIYKKTKNPAVTREYLNDKFWVYIIPDYGHQSMSPFYRDFIPMVFSSDGYKLHQGGIGMLRLFNRKQAFILLDKTIFETNPGNLKIRIVFKVNLENNTIRTLEGSNDGIYTLKLTRDDEEFKDIGDLLLSNPTDYEIIFHESTTKNEYIIRNYAINFLNITTEILDGRYVRLQGSSKEDIDGDEFVIRDYFSQAMQRDYAVSNTSSYSRGIEYELKIDTRIKTKASDKIIIRSKQTGAVFQPVNFASKNEYFSYFPNSNLKLYDVTDFSIFGSDVGNTKLKKIPSNEFELVYNNSGFIEEIRLPNNSEYIGWRTFHIIPEYNNSRKIDIIFFNNHTSSNINEEIKKVLYKSSIAGWNQQENNEKIVYKIAPEGKGYILDDSGTLSSNSEVIIFDTMTNYVVEANPTIPADINENLFSIIFSDIVNYREINDIKLYDITTNPYCIIYDPFLIIEDEKNYESLTSEIFLLERNTELGMDSIWVDPNISNLTDREAKQTDLYYIKVNEDESFIHKDPLIGDTSFKDFYDTLVKRNKDHIQEFHEYFNEGKKDWKLYNSYNTKNDNQINVYSADYINSNKKELEEQMWELKNNLKLVYANSDISNKSNSPVIPSTFSFAIIDMSYYNGNSNNFIIEINDDDGEIMYREFISFDSSNTQEIIDKDSKIKLGKLFVILPYWKNGQQGNVIVKAWDNNKLSSLTFGNHFFLTTFK